jgi:hypothetical protein
VGNKKDLLEEREVSIEQGMEKAQKYGLDFM